MAAPGISYILGRESIFISLLSTLPTGDFSTLSEVGSQILFASDKKNFRDDEEDKALRAACTQLAEFMALFVGLQASSMTYSWQPLE